MTSTNTKFLIVSQLGVGNSGGVERVSFYLKEILEHNSFNTQLITRGRPSFGKFGNIIWPFLISLKLHFIKNSFVIGNSWHCFLYPADLSIHHGTMAGTLAHCGAGKTAKITAWMEKVSAQKAKKVLAVSENCKKELISYYKINPEKIEVLNNFVDENLFYPVDHAPGKTISVLFSGSLIERKGLSKLIEFSDYIETHTEPYTIQLIIASNTKEAFHYFEGKKNTKIISGMGIQQMPDFYRSGDLLIFPTLYEGFSMATLEALASGLPVLGTDFAVTDELSDFDFCHKEDFSDISKTFENCIELYTKFSDKKKEIAAKTVERFGKSAYEKKLLSFINENNTQVE